MAVKVREYKGKWWLFIDHKGKRKKKCIGSDKRAAERAAKLVEARLALGTLGLVEENERQSFDAYWRAWLDSYVRAHCKRSTYDGYEATGRRYLIPAFGTKDIREITRDDVKCLVQTLLATPGRAGKGLAWGTLKACLAPLREMFNHAVEDGHVPANPAVRILRQTRKDAQSRRPPEAEFLTREEVAQLVAACAETCPRFHPFVLLLARTGMRLGEALGLEWGDIDFAARFAEVRRSIVEGRIETPKSGKTRRVDLSLHLTDTLRGLRVEQRKAALRTGTAVPERLFLGIDADNFRHREWRRILERAGLRHVPIKALRHTFASLMIAQDENLAYVRDQLGHSSIQVTVDVYGHLVPGGNRAAVDRLDEPAPPVVAPHPAAPQTHPESRETR